MSSLSMVTHSKYYSSAFNSAIFDGPIRIYFAQFQESAALQLYLRIQQELKSVYETAKKLHRKENFHIFIMMYPSHETFEMCFDGLDESQKIVTAKIDDDYVLGINGALDEENYQTLFFYINDIIDGFQSGPVIPARLDEVIL